MATTISRTIAVLGAALAAAAFAAAQTPALLRDVNAGPPPEPSSWPGGFHEFGGFVYFEAATPTTGCELFRTDGTAAGTALFREFTPGIGDSRIYDMCTVGARLFFGARDPAHGEELWITDGTPAGTRLVRDILPGPDAGGPYRLTAFASRAFFRASSPGIGNELWESDGTSAGTRLVRDIRAGLSSSMPDHLTALGNVLFFVADDGVHGKEPWITDGTTGGTRLLVDAFAGSTESGAEPLGVVGGRLVFRTYNGADPLWVTDGTPAGTAPIPTPLTGVRYARAVLGGVLLFAGYDPVHGSELWRTDGTQAGTWRVREFVPGSGSSEPWLLGVAGGRALLTVERSGTTELWVTDGTAAGTTFVMALDVWPSFGVELGGALLFRARDRAHGVELWRSDGTTAGTYLVTDAWPGTRGSVPGGWTRLGSRVVYSARDDLGGEPWITDGTAAGTRRIVNLGANPSHWTGDSSPSDSVDWNGTLAFSATTSRTDPWRSDGTAAGTALYHAFPGTDPFRMLNENGNPRLHVARGDLVSVVDNFPGWELWVDTGSGPAFASPIVLGSGSLPLARHEVAGGFLWLVGVDLWRVDRGVATLVPIATGQPSYANLLTRVGHALLCVAHHGSGYGLYRCDASGCVRVVDFGPMDPTVYSMVAVEDRAFVQVRDPALGLELLVTDGTPAGTRVLDLAPGAASADPLPLCAYDGALLFVADDGVHGREIWATRGTLATTARLTDLPGSVAHWPFELVRLGLDRFVFAHDDGVHGTEPWVLTPAGASLVLDVAPGPDGSIAAWLGAAGEEAYFRTPDDELWRTDGTAAGTVRLMNGLDTSGWFDVVGGRVYFDHDDGVLGHEPWVVAAGATASLVGDGCGVGMRAPWIESSDPVLGRTWIVRGGGGPPASLGLLVLGRPAPRPDLLAGGCTSFVDAGTAAVVHVVRDAARPWTYSLALPNLPALVGAELVAQAWVGPSANPSGVELTRALWLSLDVW